MKFRACKPQASINVSTNEVAPWYMAGGLLAVRDLTLITAGGAQIERQG